MKVGFIGLGKMGSRMVGKLVTSGHEVSVWNRSPEASITLKKEYPTIEVADDVEGLAKSLKPPRIIWMMITHTAVDEVLTEIKKHVVSRDVVIDAGNSNYKETDRRFKEFESEGISYLGIGTSGGILAAENGFPFMVGGSKKGYELIRPILETLSMPSGGHEYFGKGGAGHFVKMVHNGIEYGQMQALAEGFEVMEKSDYNLDLKKVAALYQKGTLVSGFLLDRLTSALEKDEYEGFVGEVDASGEADWTVETAREEGVDVKIIEESLNYRKRSKTNEKIKKSTTAKLLSALRLEFGGHEVKKGK